MLDAIGNELKVMRFRRGKSLEDVALDFDFTRETLRRYENGASGLSVKGLVELLEYYNISVNIFFENVCANIHDKEGENNEI